jgi:hypothetical protein
MFRVRVKVNSVVRKPGFVFNPDALDPKRVDPISKKPMLGRNEERVLTRISATPVQPDDADQNHENRRAWTGAGTVGGELVLDNMDGPIAAAIKEGGEYVLELKPADPR